jgi:hypothetical protein
MQVSCFCTRVASDALLGCYVASVPERNLLPIIPIYPFLSLDDLDDPAPSPRGGRIGTRLARVMLTESEGNWSCGRGIGRTHPRAASTLLM